LRQSRSGNIIPITSLDLRMRSSTLFHVDASINNRSRNIITFLVHIARNISMIHPTDIRDSWIIEYFTNFINSIVSNYSRKKNNRVFFVDSRLRDSMIVEVNKRHLSAAQDHIFYNRTFFKFFKQFMQAPETNEEFVNKFIIFRYVVAFIQIDIKISLFKIWQLVLFLFW